MKIIGLLRNNWRQRNVTVFEIPDDPDHVRTVGVPFNATTNGRTVDVIEKRSDWTRVIDLYPEVAVYD